MTMSDSLNNRQIKYNLNLKQLVIINNQLKKKKFGRQLRELSQRQI